MNKKKRIAKISNKKQKIQYLYMMIEQNRLDKIKEFFRHNPEIASNIQDFNAHNDWSPTLFASRFGYYKMLKYFLDEIKVPRSKPDNFIYLVLLAIYSGNFKVIFYLYRKQKNIPINELNLFFTNSYMLNKILISLFYLLLGARMIIRTPQDQLRTYNLSFEVDEQGLA